MIKKHQEISPKDIKPGGIYYYYHSVNRNENDLWALINKRCMGGVYCFDTTIHLSPRKWRLYLGTGGPQNQEERKYYPGIVSLPDGSYYSPNSPSKYRLITGLVDGKVGALREMLIDSEPSYDFINSYITSKKRMFRRNYRSRIFTSLELASQTMLEEYKETLEEYNHTTRLLKNVNFHQPEEEWSADWCKEKDKYNHYIFNYDEDFMKGKFAGLKVWLADMGKAFYCIDEFISLDLPFQLPQIHEVLFNTSGKDVKFIGKDASGKNCKRTVSSGTTIFASPVVAHEYIIRRWKRMLENRESLERQAEYRLSELERRWTNPRPKFYDLNL